MNLNWGIVGLGKISNKFVKDLAMVEHCALCAVASRSVEKAKVFAQEYGAQKYHASYKELFEDEDVDIIYIGTPHNSHMNLALEAMNHGKHVLCEKPLAINRTQVKRLIDASKENGVFLMEAFWSRFNPTIQEVLKRIENKEIGEVNYINADFCFYRDAPPESRLVNMELAGGALLDVGVYPVFLSYMIMGYPDDILAHAVKHESGADLQTSAILKYEKGVSNISCGFRSNSDMVAKIYGTEGNVFIDSKWHETDGYSITKGEEISQVSLPRKGKGFTYEIEECYQCIKEGRRASSLWSHSDSLNLISICDEIRSQVGLAYPFE